MIFVDLVGFTGRYEKLDPEDVRGVLSPYHARLRLELERHGGVVEKFIGDAVMAVFGAPVAHEDDPERAVRAAFAIRDWIGEQPKMQVRIAVNTGEALVSVGARPGEGEAMVAGDVVNTAARLQPAAPVDGILVGQATYRATRDAIVYRESPPVQAKGKAEPVAAWEALDPMAGFGAALHEAARTPLVGREHELELLRSILGRVRDERTAQLVTIVGIPGIGKSRLVRELFALVDTGAEQFAWREGHCLPYGEGVTFWALGEIVKAESGILESDRRPKPSASSAKRWRASRPTSARGAGWRPSCARSSASAAAGRPAQVPRVRPRPGVAFSRRWRSGDRLCSFSKTCTGPTTGCSTSSTTSSTG